MGNFKVDILNTGLIVVAFILAYFLPFELFLFSYAVLGPLHYFTEINWIKDKNYFIDNKLWIYIICAFCFIITLPTLIKLPFFESIGNNTLVQSIRYIILKYDTALFFLAIVIAFALLNFKDRKKQYGVVILGLIVAYLLRNVEASIILFSVFLPTIIHVYLFTLLFMWYGNLKTKARVGYFNVILLLLVPVIIAIINIDGKSYHFSDSVKQIFTENNFHIINVHIYKLLGLSDGTKFFFYESIDLKVQMFIAFAYTYHYLNWFSKTTVIGWHKRLNKKKTIVIMVLWIASVALYFYSYKVGLIMLLFLSMIHVFMEFPLNIISIKTIGKSFYKKR
ncbi:hypothetical protein [Pontimicrobium sp. MEBiC06410]